MSFLSEPPDTEGSRRAYDADLGSDGYVGNHTRVWCWRPDVREAFASLRSLLTDESTLTLEDRAVLVSATAGALGDAYCSLAWGAKLASLTDEGTATEVLRGGDGLPPRARALAEWARRVVRDPNGTTAAHVAELREAGLDDRQIFEATAWIAFRIAFSTVNDALGASPDLQLAEEAPEAVRRAITYGRAPA